MMHVEDALDLILINVLLARIIISIRLHAWLPVLKVIIQMPVHILVIQILQFRNG